MPYVLGTVSLQEQVSGSLPAGTIYTIAFRLAFLWILLFPIFVSDLVLNPFISKKANTLNRKFYLGLSATILTGVFCGCNHNVATFSKGVRAVVGVNPDTYMLSLGFDYGENVTLAVKEKTEAIYEGETSGEAVSNGTIEVSTTSTITTGSKLKLKTGDQTNGYVVDLEAAKHQ